MMSGSLRPHMDGKTYDEFPKAQTNPVPRVAGRLHLLGALAVV